MEIIIKKIKQSRNVHINPAFKVEANGMVADKLGWDEMLGLVASLTIPDEKPCQQWLQPKKSK